MKSKKIDLKYMAMTALFAGSVVTSGLLFTQSSKALDLSKAANASEHLCPIYQCLPPKDPDPEPKPPEGPDPGPAPVPEPLPPN